MQASQSQFTATVESTVMGSAFLDAAAALEHRLHDAEARVQTLQRDLLHAQQRCDQARRWIVGIRTHHRRHSHANTSRIIKRTLDWFDAASRQAAVLSLL